MLKPEFFARDAQIVAKDLLGKVLYKKHDDVWLSAQITETECYYLQEKASHSSLGYTEKRKAMFMSPGTIYMYYARGRDSLNISVGGEGDAVLIKSAVPYFADTDIELMQKLNPKVNGFYREPEKLCCGQTLLCQALGLKVKEWDQQQFDPENFYIKDVGFKVKEIQQTTRLGIPKGRDEHLPYRFILSE